MTIYVYILIAVGVYISLYVLYNYMLLLTRFIIKEKQMTLPLTQTRFCVIIPAHNEELLLKRLLMSIQKQDYPRELYKAIVIADNCDDNTARIGLENSAQVFERRDDLHRGKGYAIKFALERVDMKEYDALFIIDADSVTGDDLLRQLDTAMRKGARIIQCYNGVANPDESWFTRLLDVSRTIGNEILLPAKQKLGLSSNLMGNGMCFTSTILVKYGWDAFTVGEDWEYYAKLVQSGETVAFANRARVYHQESSSLKQATSQRMRWSSGRFAVIWKYGLGIFSSGLKEMNLKKVDASLPLLFPNPSLGINLTAVCFLLSIMLLLTSGEYIYFWWFLSLILIQVFIFLVGILYTRNKFKNFLSLFVAPLFLVWKIGIDILSALGLGRKEWVRTQRKL